jgi:hypothetical protein
MSNNMPSELMTCMLHLRRSDVSPGPASNITASAVTGAGEEQPAASDIDQLTVHSMGIEVHNEAGLKTHHAGFHQ